MLTWQLTNLWFSRKKSAHMAVDKVEPPKIAVLPLSKGVVHHGETAQHLHHLWSSIHSTLFLSSLCKHLLKALVFDLPQKGVVRDHLVDSKGNDLFHEEDEDCYVDGDLLSRT